jgi:methionyl-tRNA formyltransferase
MKKISEPIIFFGSGPVAAESLRLLAQDFDIEGVVTKPRPPHHKGDVPVLSLAQELSLPIKTVTSRRELDELIKSQPFHSRLGVLIDFGIIVSQRAIDYFPLGIVNSHFSLLPEWRGADPITFAILSGQEKTGVSLMLLVEAMDEGPVLGCGIQKLDPTITTPELTQKLIYLSDALLKKELPRYLNGESEGIPQEKLPELIPDYPDKPSYSRKLTKEDGLLDFNKPAVQLEREIRAYAEWPKSRAHFGELEVVVTRASVANESGKPAQRAILHKKPVVYCGEQALVIENLKPAGKKEMTGEAFLAGHKSKFLG